MHIKGYGKGKPLSVFCVHPVIRIEPIANTLLNTLCSHTNKHIVLK